MDMRADFSATKPKEHEYTMSVTMTIEDWMCLRRGMSGDTYVASRFREAISDMVHQAEKTYWPQLPESAQENP